MKIIYIGNKLSGHKLNVTSVETLGTFLQNEGFDILVSSDKKNKLFRLFDMVFAICKNSSNTKLVLIDTYSSSAFWFAYFSSLACRFLKIPYVPILRGGDLPRRCEQNPRLTKSYFNYAKVNVIPSKYLESQLAVFKISKMLFIPNTLEIEKYFFKKRNALQPRLLWVRSLAEIYNPKLALEVLKLVQEKFPSATLTMVGPSKDISMEQVQAWATEMQVEVTITGQLTKPEWIKLSESHDIFINTTNVDNTPVSVMEAMALGLSVVSTNVGGVPFLIEHKQEGLLVPPKNPKEMAQAVFQLLDDPTLVESLTRNARIKAESFDWGIVKKQWIKLLK